MPEGGVERAVTPTRRAGPHLPRTQRARLSEVAAADVAHSWRRYRRSCKSSNRAMVPSRSAPMHGLTFLVSASRRGGLAIPAAQTIAAAPASSATKR